MGGTRLMEYLRYVYGPLEGRMAYTAYYAVALVKLTNHDFPSPGWKITIGSLSTSALAALTARLQPVGRPYGLFLRTISRTYNQFGAPFGEQPIRHLGGYFLYIFLRLLWFY